MNPYLETLKDELREECGDTICQADWDCFCLGLALVDLESRTLGLTACSCDDIDDDARHAASLAKGTRADLPSIVKYAYAAIEENLK